MRIAMLENIQILVFIVRYAKEGMYNSVLLSVSVYQQLVTLKSPVTDNPYEISLLPLL